MGCAAALGLVPASSSAVAARAHNGPLKTNGNGGSTSSRVEGDALNPDVAGEPRASVRRSVTSNEVRCWDEWTPHASGGVSLLSAFVAKQNKLHGSAVGKHNLPHSGQVYWEVTFSDSCGFKGDANGFGFFVGLLDSTHNQSQESGVIGATGSWGILYHNRPNGPGPRVILLEDGYETVQVPWTVAPSATMVPFTDSIGLMADMEARPRSLSFYHLGKQLKCQISGFPSGVRIAACPPQVGATATVMPFPLKAALCEMSHAEEMKTDLERDLEELMKQGNIVLSQSWARGNMSFGFEFAKHSASERLGAELVPMRQRLKVLKLFPGGAITRQNALHRAAQPPQETIQVGDVIIRVNAVDSNDVDMMEELRKSCFLTLVVGRTQLPTRVSQTSSAKEDRNSVQDRNSVSGSSVNRNSMFGSAAAVDAAKAGLSEEQHGPWSGSTASSSPAPAAALAALGEAVARRSPRAARRTSQEDAEKRAFAMTLGARQRLSNVEDDRVSSTMSVTQTGSHATEPRRAPVHKELPKARPPPRKPAADDWGWMSNCCRGTAPMAIKI